MTSEKKTENKKAENKKTENREAESTQLPPQDSVKDPAKDPFLGQPDPDLIAELVRTFDVKPDLKPLPKYGVFLWWSDQLPQWIHPDDLELAERLVPGCKVFRREVCGEEADREAGYFCYQYGNESFRAFPIVWLEIQSDGFEVGDRIEVKSENGKRRPIVATIAEMTWGRYRQKIEYHLERNGMPLRRSYRREEIRPALRLGGHLTPREQELLSRS